MLAVDVSSSVNEDRFRLQREGIAQGLDSVDVLAANAEGPRGTIELAIVAWSEEQAVLIDWTILRCRSQAIRQKLVLEVVGVTPAMRFAAVR